MRLTKEELERGLKDVGAAILGPDLIKFREVDEEERLFCREQADKLMALYGSPRKPERSRILPLAAGLAVFLAVTVALAFLYNGAPESDKPNEDAPVSDETHPSEVPPEEETRDETGQGGSLHRSESLEDPVATQGLDDPGKVIEPPSEQPALDCPLSSKDAEALDKEASKQRANGKDRRAIKLYRHITRCTSATSTLESAYRELFSLPLTDKERRDIAKRYLETEELIGSRDLAERITRTHTVPSEGKKIP